MPHLVPGHHDGPVRQRQQPHRQYPLWHDPPHIGGPQHQLPTGIEIVRTNFGLLWGRRCGGDDGGGEGGGEAGAAGLRRRRGRGWGGGVGGVGGGKAAGAEGAPEDYGAGRGGGVRVGLLLEAFCGGGLDGGGELGGLAAERVEDGIVAPDVLLAAALVVGEAGRWRRRHFLGILLDVPGGDAVVERGKERVE